MLEDGTNYYIYGPTLTPIEQIKISSSTPSYLMADDLGSVRMITASTGSITGSYTYDAWGNIEGSSGAATSPFGYAGYYTDPASGLFYLQARWYDAKTGQFLSVDPAVQVTESPFAYANDNPANMVDPDGRAGQGVGQPGDDGIELGGGKVLPTDPDAEFPYVPPKDTRPRAKKSEDGRGYVDASGDVWTWGPPHGGVHWDVSLRRNRGYVNVSPKGEILPGGTAFSNPPIGLPTPQPILFPPPGALLPVLVVAAGVTVVEVLLVIGIIAL